MTVQQTTKDNDEEIAGDKIENQHSLPQPVEFKDTNNLMQTIAGVAGNILEWCDTFMYMTLTYETKKITCTTFSLMDVFFCIFSMWIIFNQHVIIEESSIV